MEAGVGGVADSEGGVGVGGGAATDRKKERARTRKFYFPRIVA